MPHHVNLLDASLQRRRTRLGAATGLAVIAATLTIVFAASAGLRAVAGRTALQAEQTERELGPLQAKAGAMNTAPSAALEAEWARLRVAEAGVARVREALDSGRAGVTQGYSGYLLALSRQSHEGLWLTRFDVALDGRAIELVGRTSDPNRLPDYLRRLSAERLFAGRQFSQFQLKAVDLEAGSRMVEFSLRSAAAASAPEGGS